VASVCCGEQGFVWLVCDVENKGLCGECVLWRAMVCVASVCCGDQGFVWLVCVVKSKGLCG
jgi:hypothetical protein